MIRPEEPSLINKPLYKLITNGIRCIIICSNDLRSFLRDSLPLKLPKIHIGSYLRMEVTGSTAKKTELPQRGRSHRHTLRAFCKSKHSQWERKKCSI